APAWAGARRIAVLGGAGAGKSTLARRLGEALGLPVAHLDILVYGPGWTRRAPDEVRARLSAALGDEGWIVDGTYGEAHDLTLPHADLVIWIDQPAWLRLWRCWRKTRLNRGRARPDRPDGCEEAFGWRYARMALSFGAWTAAMRNELSTHARTPVLRLRGDAAVARFLSGEADA
ncbi:MAG: hypothetical protein ACREEW_09545, partial [Caulobacteraceae bacterium]